MTKSPTFLRRSSPPDHSTLETGVRDIISRLAASADHEVSEILAGGVNLYTSAMIRFRGNSAMHAPDIKSLFAIWQILLDVKKEPAQDFSSGREEVEPLQPEIEDK